MKSGAPQSPPTRGCDIAIYGGSALMLASNFRFGTEDVDIAELGEQWPDWLKQVVDSIAVRNGWSKEWLNDGVTFHLSSLAVPVARSGCLRHVSVSRLRRQGSRCSCRLRVTCSPSSSRLCASHDFGKGSKDVDDVRNLLLAVLGVTEVEPAIEILTEFFPEAARMPTSSVSC